MPSMLDHVADANGAELARLARLYEFPDFVKKAELSQTMGSAGVPASTYGDPRTRQFPCHTAASTWLSALFFREKQSEFHPKDQKHIEGRINDHASYFRIKAAVDLMRSRWAELHKTAEEQLPDSSYAWVWAGEDGSKDRRLPIRNTVEVKVAAEWLEEHRDAVAYADRQAIATRIHNKANAIGAGLGKSAEFIERQAGRGACSPDEVVAMVRGRALLTGNDALKSQFYKMAQALAESPKVAFQPDMLIKLAATVDQLDRTLGLAGKYSDGVPRPEDVIFRVTYSKAASDYSDSCGTTTGSVYEKAAFRRLSVEDVKDMFGDDFVERVSGDLGGVDPEKMAEEVAALPRPDAEMLDRLMNDRGIAPLVTKAASSKVGLSPSDVKAFASQYAANLKPR